jgi:hypothetical protein
MFCRQTEEPFSVQILTERFVLQLTMQIYAYVKAAALRRAANVLDGGHVFILFVATFTNMGYPHLFYLY